MLKFFLQWITILALIFPAFLYANTVSGRITQIQVPTNDDINSVYFKIDSMPAGVTQWLYIRFGTGDAAGCSVKGNEATFDRAYSALLAAHFAKATVSLVYCLDSHGYGLVNQHIGILK
jgi:hypothetical protein